MANIKDQPDDELRQVDKIILGERLRMSRRKSGYTAEQVAEKIKRAVDYIYQLERGKTMPSVKTLMALTRLYKVSLDYLLQNDINDPLNPDKIDLVRQEFIHRITKLPQKQFKMLQQIADIIEQS